METDELIKALNAALADEWLAHYQYWVGSKVINGPLKDEVIDELEEHSNDELRHAGILADLIIDLGGTPLLTPNEWFQASGCGYDIPSDPSSAVILEQNIKGEQCAIDTYSALIKAISVTDSLSIEILQEILDDEIEHKEDLESLLDSL